MRRVFLCLVALALLFAGAAYGQGSTPGSTTPVPAETPRTMPQRMPSPAAAPPSTIAAPPAAQPRQAPRQVTDPFAGLNYTEEQKAKINEIRQNTKTRMDLVVKDNKLDSEQKQAMLQGFWRLETGEIFKVLTPEQQKEVRQKLTAQRAAGQQQKKAQQQPTVLPH